MGINRGRPEVHLDPGESAILERARQPDPF